MKQWYSYCVTMGPIGYFMAPGTLASIVSIPVVYALHYYIPDRHIQLGIIVLLAIFGLWVIRKALVAWRRQDEDPSEIVFDEFIGCLITWWGIGLTTQTVLVGFILFRFFDILKPGGIRFIERLNGEWGIMIDDILAAILANIILRFLF
ncbi:MAG TPA: phosphatidylglycerophosphatase A [Candidatus Dependentiae bacterium]|nr:phosphatidylglycerophosphatase A [Candidatus Dependentiae bacterium]HRQ62775.1 phosphatidylglycerophosphatase A [Candidatus Dependentiae bacterium]